MASFDNKITNSMSHGLEGGIFLLQEYFFNFYYSDKFTFRCILSCLYGALVWPFFVSCISDFLFKFLVIGSAGTGKSCILHQFIENKCKLQVVFVNLKHIFIWVICSKSASECRSLCIKKNFVYHMDARNWHARVSLWNLHLSVKLF
jgi:hypothetical protein